MNNINDISISMLIDNDIKNSSVVPNINEFKPLPLKSSINIDERRIYQWVKDENVVSCHNCSNSFTILNRKHHCRNCGKIFCSLCSNYFIEIPNNIKTVPKENNLLDYKTYLEYFNIGDVKERVCRKCYDKIFELKELNKTIKFFDLLPLDILAYRNLSSACKSWNKISKYYFSYFREIQYFFPDHIYTTKEKNILINNKNNLIGHSKWLLQLVLITDWENSNASVKQDTLNILQSSTRRLNCWELMCTRSCCNELQPEDIIIILSKKYTYFPLIKYLIKLLDKVSDYEFTCYITYIVSLLHFYKNFSSISREIEQFLINKCKVNNQLCNQLFWTITQCISNPESNNYFKQFRQELVKILDKKQYKLFQNGYDFTLNLIQLVNSSNDNMVENIVKYLKDYKFDNNSFNLPVNFDKTFLSIDISKIRAIDSKTRPIILPCRYNTRDVFNIMLKKEDIRKEEIIMKIIKLMDFFLKKEENLDLLVTVYNILPISNEYGYIEFVQNSSTLYNIRECLNFSIQNYILEKNPNMNIHDFRERLAKSSAIYCVITYLLGIGDRHLDNIMITEDGCIFHIDFGYILGHDPKPLYPDIRLTPEMIDALGGKKSIYYNKFKEYSGKAYNCLRRHSPIFYILLLSLIEQLPPINDPTLNKSYIRNHIIQRFIPGENYKDANDQFSNKIDKNSNTYSESLIDFFHKKNKISSNSSTDDNIVDMAIKTSKNVTEKITSKIYNILGL